MRPGALIQRLAVLGPAALLLAGAAAAVQAAPPALRDAACVAVSAVVVEAARTLRSELGDPARQKDAQAVDGAAAKLAARAAELGRLKLRDRELAGIARELSAVLGRVAGGLRELGQALRRKDDDAARRAHGVIAREQAALASALARLARRCPPPEVPA